MATSDKMLAGIEKLTWKNYQHWSFKVQTFLRREGCWKSITDECPTEDPAKSAWESADNKALTAIILSVENSQLIHVRKAKSAKEAWDNLKKYHQKSTLSSKVRILKKICKSELKKGGDVEKHILEIREALEDLESMGYEVPKDIQMYLLLGSLNEDYDNIVTALDGRDEATLTIEEVTAKVMQEFDKMKHSKDSVKNESALQSSSRNFDKRNSGTKNNNNNNNKKKDLSNIICYNCKKAGHYATKCPSKQSSAKEEKSNEQRVQMAVNESQVAFSSSANYGSGWYIDSGASSHICKDESLISNLNPSIKEEITVANGEILKSEGRGDTQVCVNVNNNARIIPINDVMFVPKAESNLLSVKRLTAKGFKVCFEGEICEISRNNSVVAIGELDSMLYKLKEENSKVLAASSSESTELCIHQWHLKLAHRNLADIQSMKNYGLTIKDCECSDICESCIKGKMHRKPFPRKASNDTKETFDIVVSDVCGPMQEESTGGSRYFVTFIDIHSRFCTVYFIKQKSEVAEKLIQFVEKVKTKFSKKPKVIRSDRGTEYTNHRVQEYLKSEGIAFECTVGYAPQQNGIAERKNRSLMEAARTMLYQAKMKNCWWAEAVNTANFIQNRVISKPTKLTPYEVYYNEKPKLLDLHTFGCDVYSMIPQQKRRKLDSKAVKLKFVGYDEESKGYRLASQNKVIISREVNFLDDKHQSQEESVEEIYIDLHSEFEEVIEDIEEDENESFHSIVDENSEDEEIIAEQEVAEEPIMVRRTTRANAGQAPKRFDNFLMAAKNIDTEPISFNDAMQRPNKNKWLEAMKEELKSIKDNQTWELVDLPKGRTAIGSKWIFKIKCGNSGEVNRYKARLVAQGFSQKFGTDYDEVFAPVARSTTFKIMMAVAAKQGYQVKHFDVKTAFLYGKLEEEIFMKQPPGFEQGSKVCKLKKSLYGLKQAARQWNIEINRVLTSIGAVQSMTDKCLYTIKREDQTAYIMIHVDDLLIAASHSKLVKFIAEGLKKEFDIKDLGDVKQYLGIDVVREDNDFYLSQQKYIDKVVAAAGQEDAKVSSIPIDAGYYKVKCDDFLDDNYEYRKLIGMLLYISSNTRPDIAASVSILSQKTSNPSSLDMNEVKRVIRYLKGTRDMQLKVSNKSNELILEAFSDANWAEDRSDRKSNSGYIFMLGGGTVSWCCRKQSCVSQSSTEAEYYALGETCQELIWLRELCKDFNIVMEQPIKVNVDNQSCMKLVDRQKFSNRTKHVDVKYHFVQDLKESQVIELFYCPTDKNIADMLTKPLQAVKLRQHRESSNVKKHFWIEEEC